MVEFTILLLTRFSDVARVSTAACLSAAGRKQLHASCHRSIGGRFHATLLSLRWPRDLSRRGQAKVLWNGRYLSDLLLWPPMDTAVRGVTLSPLLPPCGEMTSSVTAVTMVTVFVCRWSLTDGAERFHLSVVIWSFKTQSMMGTIV